MLLPVPRIEAITTGNHEYPFNLDTELPEDFERHCEESRAAYQALLNTIRALSRATARGAAA
jgi:hypothetical protein